MTPDEFTPCPFCPDVVRALFRVACRVVERERQYRTPEYEELAAIVATLQPFYDAHYANQAHAFSTHLEDARSPIVVPAAPRELLALMVRT